MVKLNLTKVKFGFKLKIELSPLDNEYDKWFIEDSLNGKSETTDVTKPIYGFFSENKLIKLSLLKNGKIVKVIPSLVPALSEGGGN